MRGRSAAFALFAAAGLAAGAQAFAQELVYTPVNPSFGGDSFNSSHLIGIANAQNDYDDPDGRSSRDSQADQFIRQLQSRLLSSLAGEVNEAIFGENPQDEGTITFGDQIIEFVRGVGSVHLTITDLSTGTVTEIEIPLLNVTDGSDPAGSILAPTLTGNSEQGSMPVVPNTSGDLTGSSLYEGMGEGSLTPSGGIY
ncbi:curli assembly protein CsgF [Henriciella sp.]|uniref:curli assembly protein CsgF n=1 Tax=Henriciella sp. TaxID=1968823 RepID=UPI0026143257|nr:curli assembly protein CsgF [Henriciella sp.]